MISVSVNIVKKLNVGVIVTRGNLVSCSPVTILDQDENILALLPSGSSYPVIVVSAINGGNSSTVYTNSIIDAP